jgi:hypothetical protein
MTFLHIKKGYELSKIGFACTSIGDLSCFDIDTLALDKYLGVTLFCSDINLIKIMLNGFAPE